MASAESPYASIHYISSLDEATIDDLRLIIQTYPVIDNHAHNLFRTSEGTYETPEQPFDLITSEASGSALTTDSHKSLAHIRGVKQLAQFYECNPVLEDVKVARRKAFEEDYVGTTKECLAGTHAILIDDGLAAHNPSVLGFEEHKEFVPKVGRIVRVETLAEEVLKETLEKKQEAGVIKVGESISRQAALDIFWYFSKAFHERILGFKDDPQVYGFKSIIAYRTGLDISLPSSDDIPDDWYSYLKQIWEKNIYRCEHKTINDFLVETVCEHLTMYFNREHGYFPFQFHTGLGDTDLNLLKSNPAHLQPLIERHPEVDFVLLHSSYPYTREAGYLATHYSNVWLDIGEVFPMLSRDGEKSVLRQTLELVPTNKILWSTDGRYYPETYWLANHQFRGVLEDVLVEYVKEEDISVKQAIEIAVDILFWNSNKLYMLKEEERYPELLRACGRLTKKTSDSNESSFPHTQETVTSITKKGCGQGLQLRIWDRFHQKNPTVKYVWIQFLDYTATMRQRMIPIAKFRNHIETGSYPSITLAAKGLLQDDRSVPGNSATGQFLLLPDLSTLSLNYGIQSPSCTVQSWWIQDIAGPISTHENLPGCPRWSLQLQENRLKEEFGIDITMGFEVEICFLKPVENEQGNEWVAFNQVTTVHSWSNMTTQQQDLLPMIEEIVDTLDQAGIPLPQFHAESAPGQWEFPLPCYRPVKAVDTLYRAREIIRNVAKKYGLRATLYPRPLKNACGSASHAHFSISGPGDTVSKYENPFLAGVLEHLGSILAFTLPIEESYARVAAGIWAGGIYAAWGTQNREVPLRKCGPGHWELKSVDGIGNMYLSMAALLASGLDGLRKDSVLTHRDCKDDPSLLAENARRELGIQEKLPSSLEKSLKLLEGNTMLKEALEGVVEPYVSAKKAELEMLRGFGGVDDVRRRVWLISRY